MSQTSEKTLYFDIGGMHCAACSSRLERVFGLMDSVEKAEVNLASARAAIVPKPGYADAVRQGIPEKAVALGFSAVAAQAGDHDDPEVRYAEIRAAAQAERRERLFRLVPMAAFALPLFIISMGHMVGLTMPAALDPHHAPHNFAMAQLLLTLPVVFLGRHFYSEGFAALLRRAPNMDSLVAMGTGAAFAYSLVTTVAIFLGQEPATRAMDLYYESTAVLLTMIELGQFLESAARRRAGDAMGALLRLTPPTALRLNPHDAAAPPEEVPLAQVHVGDTLLVRPGGRVPVDGEIVQGQSAVDLSLLTGESIPVAVAVGSQLPAGSVNGEGPLTIRAERVGRDTQLSGIIRLVREAQGSKAPIARLADQVSYYFVPAVMAFAVLAALAWAIFSNEPLTTAFTVFVAVLVMACPCAMGLATPMSIMVGTGRGAQLGVLIKNGAAIEAADKIVRLCVDKTGTLTTGKPELTAIVPLHNIAGDGLSENDFLTLAAALESRSEHPLALALVRAAEERHCPPCAVDNVEVTPGLGIAGTVHFANVDYRVAVGSKAFMDRLGASVSDAAEAQLVVTAEAGQTPLLLALERSGMGLKSVGILALADALRPESAAVVAHLERMNVAVAMLSGDNTRTAQAVAQQAGISTVAAGQMPEEKAAFVRLWQSRGETVGMVGDGINDAPALAAADLGMAVGTSVDVSAEAADIVLMRGGMQAVLTALSLSRAVMRNIRQNLFWAFGYNILGLPVAAGLLHVFGGPMLSPMLAGTAMALSSVSVVLNALRLRLFKP